MYDIYLLLCVECWTPDDGQRNCLKHVEFYSKNKFEKLMHLVGFSIRIYLLLLIPQSHNFIFAAKWVSAALSSIGKIVSA